LNGAVAVELQVLLLVCAFSGGKVKVFFCSIYFYFLNGPFILMFTVVLNPFVVGLFNNVFCKMGRGLAA